MTNFQKTVFTIFSLLALISVGFFVFQSVKAISIKSNLDVDDRRIVNLNHPPLYGHYAATKKYVDDTINGFKPSQWLDGGSYIYAKNATNVVVTDSGYVGVGDTTPSYKLDVAGEGIIDGGIYAYDSTGIGLLDSSGNTGVWVEQGGDVGIGTRYPNYQLDINGSIKAVGFYKNGTLLENSPWEKSGSDIYFDKTTTRVGIGAQGSQSFPSYTLDIAGDLNATEYYKNGQKLNFAWKKESSWSNNIYYNSGNVAIGKQYPNYTLDVSGSLAVSGTKNFVIDHPAKPGMELVHATLEGPEAAVFYRGEGQLVNGQAIVELPDYFEALTRKEGRTVLVTPRIDFDDEKITGLAVGLIVNGKFKIKAIGESNPEQKFYWEVKAIRNDIPLLETEIKTK